MQTAATTHTALISQLSSLAEQHPAYADLINDCAEEIEFKAERMTRSERQRVVDALREGYQTIADICKAASVKDWKARELCLALEAEGAAERRRCSVMKCDLFVLVKMPRP